MVTALRGIEIQKYLQSLNRGWVDETDTVDTWKSGDPLVEVRGIAVAWMGYSHALEKAAELGCNLFIVHEPVYYHHRDDDPDILAWPECKARQMTIEKLGLSILRCHDLWDQFPGLGIPDAWGQKLGLGQPLAGEGYLQLIGPPERQVQRIVLGTGAATPYREMLIQYEADLVICCDDGFKYWRDGAHAIDNGHSVLIFHHPVTEEYGMQLLAEHLAERFPTIPVHFIPEKCMYQLVLP
ncbi:MAG: Nif3-like dinuclear metal center hexameric protein [Anaerolineales bacterium]